MTSETAQTLEIPANFSPSNQLPSVFLKPAVHPSVHLFNRPLPKETKMPSTSVGQRRAARKAIMAKFAGKLTAHNNRRNAAKQANTRGK